MKKEEKKKQKLEKWMLKISKAAFVGEVNAGAGLAGGSVLFKENNGRGRYIIQSLGPTHEFQFRFLSDKQAYVLMNTEFYRGKAKEYGEKLKAIKQEGEADATEG